MTGARMRLQVSPLFPRPLFVLCRIHPNWPFPSSAAATCAKLFRPAQTSLLPPYCPLLQAAEALDPREGRWQALPPAPLARSSFGIAMLHDCVYAVGGNIGTEVLNDVSLRGSWGMPAHLLLQALGWRSELLLCCAGGSHLHAPGCQRLATSISPPTACLPGPAEYGAGGGIHSGCGPLARMQPHQPRPQRPGPCAPVTRVQHPPAARRACAVALLLCSLWLLSVPCSPLYSCSPFSGTCAQAALST